MIAVDLITHGSVIVYAVIASLFLGWGAEALTARLRDRKEQRHG